MSIFALGSLLAAATTAFMGSFVHYRNPRGLLHRIFFLYCLSGSFASFAEFEYRQAGSFDAAQFWIRASFVWVFAIPLELHFVMRFAEKTRLLEKKLTYLVLYLPALTFSTMWLIGAIPLQPAEAPWGWTYVRPQQNAILDGLGAYVGIASSYELFVCGKYYLREAEGKKKRQAGFILAGIVITMFLVLISEPGWLFGQPAFRIPRLTSVGFVVEAILVARAMQKYELFSLSPSDAAASLIATLADAVFLVDPEGKIAMVNQATLNLLGYRQGSELTGRPFESILGRRDIPADLGQIRFEEIAKAGSMSDVEVTFITRDSQELPVSLSASVVQDEAGTDQGIVYVGRDLTERKRTEEQIRASLQEKEILLKEIHHRVKNNLQIISSLLRLQSRDTQDEAALGALNESRNRVHSMAIIHETLYRSEGLARVDLATYTQKLVDYLLRSYNFSAQTIRTKIDIADVSLDMDAAICCGLIINELVSNSLKHAFPAGQGGEINIALHLHSDQQLILTVGDDGAGLPADIGLDQAESLGLQLVNMLVQQLQGTLELDCSQGTQFRITFGQ